MISDQNYPFLELLTESEATSQGIYPTDRYIYAVYKSLLAASDLRHAKSGNLFSMTSEVLEVNDMTRQDRINALKRLISDRLATQLFYLQYVPEKQNLAVVPVYISGRDEESRIPGYIFDELAAMSANAVQLLTDAKSGAGPDVKQLWQDLENDLNGNAKKNPAGLRTVTDPLAPFQVPDFPIRPHASLVPATLNKIENLMIDSGRFVKLRGFGFLPVRTYEIIPVFELVSDFLATRLIPGIRDKGNLRRDLGEISLAETSYYLDEFAVKSSAFSARRARAVRKAVTGDSAESENQASFPGALACEIILQLEPRAQSAYDDEHRRMVHDQISEIRDRLLSGKNWRDLVLFFDEDQYESLSPDVKNSLLTDNRLICGSWEEESGTVTVFLPREIISVKKIITGMLDAEPEEFWKVLALRQQIDQNNAIYGSMFEDADFVKSYGRLLRMVYLTYISWIHRFLFWLGITLFQDTAFQSAKQTIAGEQAARAERNRSRQARKREKKESEKKAAIDRLAGNTQLNRLIEALDHFYFSEETVPSFEDIKSWLKAEDDQALRDQLKEEKFQILDTDSDETPGDAVILYPLDFDWNTKSARLLRMTDRVRERLSGKDDFESKFLMNRIKKVTEFIVKSRKSGRAKGAPETKEDPYEKLDRVIKEKEGAAASSA